MGLCMDLFPRMLFWGRLAPANEQVSSQNLRASATPVSLDEALSSTRFLKRSITLLCGPRMLVSVTVSARQSLHQEGL